MSYITADKKDSSEKPHFRRRSIKETLTVCPKCFSTTKMTPGLFISASYTCSNHECGWVGTLGIEVDRQEYMEFLEKQAR
ncbi:MAG: hypothetical protein KGD64_14670 [Candidatus Heimdallarchaeota archaeon]|nr:hypothetical protein [Candidatus Heimdallarchaeota archaeon]